MTTDISENIIVPLKIYRSIKYSVLLLIQLNCVPDLIAQLKIPQASVETGATISNGDHSPFWLSANKFGYISADPLSMWIRPEIRTDIDWDKRFDYSYGLDVWGRYDGNGKLFVQQGWVKAKLFFFTVYGGRMEEFFGNQDSSLSSGGLLWSGNAPPLPKIAINVEHWTKVPFTCGYFDFKGGISHGWLGDQPYVKNTYIHHKYVYIRFGGKLPVHAHYGFHHYAHWGGTSQFAGKLPVDLKTYVEIFFAQRNQEVHLPDGTTVITRGGNHIGTRNFGLDFDLKKYRICSYWQTVFEDGSGKRWKNINDGLWGVTFKSRNESVIAGVMYEFFHSTDQSGTFNWDPVTKKEYGGNDDYFNHYLYKHGWTYDRYTLGTPLITSPLYLSGNTLDYIRNNKIIAHHIGLEGYKSIIYYRLLYTYSLNFGTNNFPIQPAKSQHSVLISTSYADISKFKIDLGLNLGGDLGKMYGNNLGIQIVLKKYL
jgi:hypothetical protein